MVKRPLNMCIEQWTVMKIHISSYVKYKLMWLTSSILSSCMRNYSCFSKSRQMCFESFVVHCGNAWNDSLSDTISSWISIMQFPRAVVFDLESLFISCPILLSPGCLSFYPKASNIDADPVQPIWCSHGAIKSSWGVQNKLTNDCMNVASSALWKFLVLASIMTFFRFCLSLAWSYYLALNAEAIVEQQLRSFVEGLLTINVLPVVDSVLNSCRLEKCSLILTLSMSPQLVSTELR